MPTFLELLGLLEKLGPRLPKFLADLETVFNGLRALIADAGDIFPTQPVKLSVAVLPAADRAALDRVCAVYKAHAPAALAVAGHAPVAAFDGHRIIGLFAFMQAHPEITNFIMQIIQGMLKVA